MTSKPLGVYVHFPWCRKLCPYCDFPVAVAAGEPPHDAYLARILDELAAQAPTFGGRRLRSIYFGGGTPSLWRADCIAQVIERVRGTWGPSDDLEITLETNPTDCTPARLAAWRTAGVNRLSIGVQSLDPRELVVLGRDHRHGDGLEAIAAAAAAGFASLSADHILGAPLRGARPTVGDSLAALAAQPLDHLSVYELTIEPGTAFGQRVRDGRLKPLPDDTLAELYEAAHGHLTAQGWEHYEVSSYARPGRRARHNGLYWSGAEYLGLGTGAASFCVAADGSGRRWTNPRRAEAYLAGDGMPALVETSSPAEVARDGLWLGMRTVDGVDAAALARWPALVAWMLDTGVAEERGGRVCPTLRGFLFSNQIAARIVALAESGPQG